MRLLLSATLLIATTAAAGAAPPRVVADTPVTGSLVQQVLGDLAQVRVLMGGGADPHHYQMRPSDARALQTADLLVWTGPQLTPWLDRPADNLNDRDRLSLLAHKGTHLRQLVDAPDEDDHTHHGHADEHDDDHHHDGADPHAWLDPANGALWMAAIADALTEKDPENAQTYQANAASASTRLRALDDRIAAQLTPLRDLPFIVFHDAYGYFTDHFGLTPAIAISLGDASAPSAAQISAVQGRIADTAARCAFPEFGHDPSLIDSATEGNDVTVGPELDPGGRALREGPDLYGKLFENMADSLTDCLG